MENNTGCIESIIAIISALVASFLSFSSMATSTDAPLVETDYSFVLADEGVNYSFIETFNCQFVVAGNIEFLQDANGAHENIGVILQPLATYDDRPPTTLFLGDDTRFGDQGWSILLVGRYSYLVWVQDLTSDTPLSSKVWVDDLDCANKRTLAQVNFRQIRPFS